MPLSVLTAADLLRGMADPDASRVERMFADRRFPQGATIFSRGDPADSLYVVKEGLVKLSSISEKGTETILHLLKPGDIFGELLLSEAKRAFTAVAAEDVLAGAIARKSFVDLLGAVPALSENFIRLLSTRLAKVEREFADFGHTWSYHRLAIVLLELGKEHGIETPKGVRIGLRLTHEELAKLIGTTRETVTMQMSRLARKGLVRREGRAIVLNRPRLLKFVGAEEPGESVGPPAS